MREWLEIAAVVLVSLAVYATWDFGVVVALRVVGIKLSFPRSLHAIRGRADQLFASVHSRRVFVFISGILLFACPLFIMMTSYDLMVGRLIEHTPFTAAYAVGSIVVLGVFIAVGVWMGCREWSERMVAEK